MRANFKPQRSSPKRYICLFWVLLLLLYLFSVFFFFNSRSNSRIDARDEHIEVDFSSKTSSSYLVDDRKEYTTKKLSSWQGGEIDEIEIEDGYPTFRPLLEVVQKWNPDDPDIPEDFRETLMIFNYSNPAERRLAEKYRDAELPFKVYDVPEVQSVSRKWTDSYLGRKMDVNVHVERSKDNHFMFFKAHRGGRANYKPPQENVNMKFTEWLKRAKEADRVKLNNASEHYYLTVGTSSRFQRTFFAKDLSMFSTSDENFFITDVDANKGIQCRFGMRGVIAESHYDAGRNMVAMLKGAKRYVLSPPESCKYLGIIGDSKHPSFRHSLIDWSSEEQAKANQFDKAKAIDTILKEGEVLYIPSFWFHYIVSLRYSIQCNSRSGSPPGRNGYDEILKCLNLDTMGIY